MNQENYPVPAPAGLAGTAPATLPARTATQRAAAEIRGLMAARQLNAIDLCDVLELSRTSVTRRFNGYIDMTINELEAIAAWLDVPITRLIAPDSTRASAK